MINDSQIELVQESFRHVVPIADVAGRLFYERVFTLAPETRSLFGDDIGLQATRTMAAVKTAVDGLGDWIWSVRSSSASARVTSATACDPSTSRSSARRCCGHSSKGSASCSRRRPVKHGLPPGT